jgi:hypothetical protein
MTTETNLLTKVNFSEFPATMPSTWYLGNYIPNGALDVSHIQARWRPQNAFWQPWEQVASWDNTTKVAGFFKAGVSTEVEFRRVTPRYSLWRDPLARTERVSENNFHANADQGLFVATEWAAQYGIDALQVMLAEPGDGPNELGLIQQTQNHWGSNANFFQLTWNFQFAGGYIDRSHVKAQALLPSGWVSLTIDPSENDPAHPSNAPFRFIGDYQLRLDLATLGAPVTGLVIYRHTPRNINVTVPGDHTRITAPVMEPSARHAVFVAVEIGEELAKRVPPCECALFYTSTIYPYIAEETLSAGLAVLVNGVYWGFPDDTVTQALPVLQSGTLVSAFTFIDYTNQRDVNPDTLAQALPVLQSGTLVLSVNPVSYTNQRDVNPDTLAQEIPVLQSGTLVVTISYVDYTNQRDVSPDTLAQALPVLQSGTLV